MLVDYSVGGEFCKKSGGQYTTPRESSFEEEWPFPRNVSTGAEINYSNVKKDCRANSDF
jgi:hypothetical protein